MDGVEWLSCEGFMALSMGGIVFGVAVGGFLFFFCGGG